LNLDDYKKVLFIVASLASYTQFGFIIISSPQLGENSSVAEELADMRRHHEERLHNNQPEWTRGTRGAQQEALVQQELGALADRRRQCDERQHNNQLEKRCKRGTLRGGGAMRGNSAMRGKGAGGWEAAT
jgi:hypothetical protein